MLAKYGDKKYYLKYVEGKINKIRVEVEYTVIKRRNRSYGLLFF